MQSSFEVLFSRNPQPMWVFDPETLQFLEVNDAALNHYGYTRDEFLRLKVTDVRPAEDVPRFLNTRRAAGRSSTHFGNWRHRKRDGEIIDVEINAQVIQFNGRAAELVVIRDITQNVRAQQEIRETEAKYRALVEQLDAITYTAHLGLEGKWIFVSPQAESILGYPAKEFLDDSTLWSRRIHPEDRAVVEAAEQGTLRGHPFRADYRMIRRDGQIVWISDSGVLVRSRDQEALLHGVMLDITERKQLEAQLQQAQKMEAVGTLAGGVAHDFNNLLTVIKGYSRLVIEEAETDEQIVRQVGEIEKAADRAASLTSQLLAFSRRQMIQPKVLSLNVVVASMEKMLRRVIGEDLELITQLASDIGNVKADPGQLEQVLLNLAINSRDAMSKGGKLIFQTANVILDADFIRENPGAEAGDYVMVAVSDTGTGMDERTRSRIFEPFFTTKDVGKGTGLGLAMVYGIVKQSGGYITVESLVGAGATFRIYLPRIAASETAGAQPPVRERFHGHETVLLVEDDDSLRELTRKILGGLGYNVLIASQAAQAQEVCARFDGKIHLLLSDVVMPGATGGELVSRLLPLRPEMKAILMSGYADRGLEPGVAALGDNLHFLQKPFSPQVLAAKLREVLDAAPAPI